MESVKEKSRKDGTAGTSLSETVCMRGGGPKTLIFVPGYRTWPRKAKRRGSKATVHSPIITVKAPIKNDEGFTFATKAEPLFKTSKEAALDALHDLQYAMAFTSKHRDVTMGEYRLIHEVGNHLNKLGWRIPNRSKL